MKTKSIIFILACLSVLLLSSRIETKKVPDRMPSSVVAMEDHDDAHPPFTAAHSVARYLEILRNLPDDSDQIEIETAVAQRYDCRQYAVLTLQSPEFLRVLATSNSKELVARLYIGFLERKPTLVEFEKWIPILEKSEHGLETLTQDLWDSPEFLPACTAPTL